MKLSDKINGSIDSIESMKKINLAIYKYEFNNLLTKVLQKADKKYEFRIFCNNNGNYIISKGMIKNKINNKTYSVSEFSDKCLTNLFKLRCATNNIEGLL